MEILIAKIIGVIYLAFGIGLLFNKEFYLNAFKDILTNSSYLILGGFLAILFGILIIEYHNIWINSWIVIITIVGWIALIKGIVLLAFPRLISIYKPIVTSNLFYKIITPLVLIFGFILVYLSFYS